MSGLDYEQLTLFQGDSPASRLVLPGDAEARMMTVTSGQRCCALSKKSGPLGSLVKMLLVSSAWHSTKCYLTWKIAATPAKRLLFRLAASTPHIEGTDAQLWATPNVPNGGRVNPPDMSPTGRMPDGRKRQVGLEHQVKMVERGLWPTPTARDSKGSNIMEHLTREGKRNHTDQMANAVKLWPTPTVYGNYNRAGISAKAGDGLATAVKIYPTPTTGAGLCGGSGNYNQIKALEEAGEITADECRSMAAGNGGQLNPDWVEALMGFPSGWTVLEPDGGMAAGKQESPE